MMNSASACIRALCAATVFFSMAACVGADAGRTLRSGRFELAEHQSVALAPSASLRYDSVADSRCPAGVMCVWAGKTSYRFTLTSSAGSESFALDKEGDQFASTALQGVSVALARTAVPGRAPAQHAVVVDIVVN